MAAPKLRFKEFDGDWFQSKIGEIFQVTSGSTPLRSDNRFFENADIAWVKTTDLNNGLIEKTEEKISQIALKETSVKILPKGTVFVAMYGGFNQIGRTGLLVHEAACNQALSAIYPNEKIDSYFLLTFLNHKVDDWKNFAASSRKDPNITKSDVLAFPLKYPVKEEQTKIASFLSVVDEKISQLTQKHALLSQYKQGMMQKLFSQQIRFKADDGSEFGEWENSYIGNECKITTGNKDTQNKVDDGLYPFFVRSQTVEKINSYSMDCEAILTSGDGVGVGKNYHYMNGKFDFHQRVYCLYEFSERLIGRYLYIYFSNYFYDRVKRLSAKNSVDSVRMDMISKMEIKLPCLEEQTKIANFLSAIDQKIEVVAQQIEQAKMWKKGLLQQMFV